ncbi:hypothetical protein CHS0354_021571 [Potamilus streckersoni]|uniref:Uncharacterized protein n=1 Tax=Potamilus streckersoni TaxID=2493646 RepID=A0AAE0W8H2_9BIVA|nr:hypothetical protein CHS0354_021571 [Potamilus streckersoni]
MSGNNKRTTVVTGGMGLTGNRSLLDSRNGLYKYKPYKPTNIDYKHKEYKPTQFKPTYTDPLKRKVQPYEYKPYTSETGYNKYYEYKLPSTDPIAYKANEDGKSRKPKPAPKLKNMINEKIIYPNHYGNPLKSIARMIALVPHKNPDW